MIFRWNLKSFNCESWKPALACQHGHRATAMRSSSCTRAIPYTLTLSRSNGCNCYVTSITTIKRRWCMYVCVRMWTFGSEGQTLYNLPSEGGDIDTCSGPWSRTRRTWYCVGETTGEQLPDLATCRRPVLAENGYTSCQNCNCLCPLLIGKF